MTLSYQAPDRWSPLPEEAFAAITPTGTQAGTRVLGGLAGPLDPTHSFAATIVAIASSIPDDQDDAVVLADSEGVDGCWRATQSGKDVADIDCRATKRSLVPEHGRDPRPV